eukprot:131511-Pleurochrysis_carterae.AAC.6
MSDTAMERANACMAGWGARWTSDIGRWRCRGQVGSRQRCVQKYVLDKELASEKLEKLIVQT